MDINDAMKEVKDLLTQEGARLKILISYKENKEHKGGYDPVQDMGAVHQIDDEKFNLELIKKAFGEVQQLEQAQVKDKEKISADPIPTKHTSEVKR